MKFAIDIGHNCPIPDTGAVGVMREDELTRAVGSRLIELLEINGHEVIETAPREASSVMKSLQYRVTVANLTSADVFISLHFNAANFKAHGTEVYALSKIGAGIGRQILEEIVKLGFYNRGVKRANFYVLRETKMPAVLVECCFCDSRKDMDLFDSDLMAQAICEGLIGEAPETPDQLRTIKVKHRTWLKAKIQQSTALPTRDKIRIDPGSYQLLAALPEEEKHYWVRTIDGTEGFIYSGHAELT